MNLPGIEPSGFRPAVSGAAGLGAVLAFGALLGGALLGGALAAGAAFFALDLLDDERGDKAIVIGVLREALVDGSPSAGALGEEGLVLGVLAFAHVGGDEVIEGDQPQMQRLLLGQPAVARLARIAEAEGHSSNHI